MQVPSRWSLARQSNHFPTWPSATGTSVWFWMHFSQSAAWKNLEKFGCVVFARLFTSSRKTTLPVRFPLPTISWSSLFTLFCPLILDQGACFKIPFVVSKLFVDTARCFFSPLCSICDNHVRLPSDESPHCKIPIRSWVSQTLVFSICPIPSWDGIFVIDIEMPSHFESNSWILSFQTAKVTGRHNCRQSHCLKWLGSGRIRRSSKRCVFMRGRGLLCQLSFPPDWRFSWSGYSGWFCSVLKQFLRRATLNLVHEFLW